MQYRRLFLILLAATLLSCAGNDPFETLVQDAPPPPPDFAYSGPNGPAFWGGLRPEWAACSSDNRQSPVDLSGAVPDPALPMLDLDTEPLWLDLVNNGKTIEHELHNTTLTIDGVVHHGRQFHFHTLSEHTVAGERYLMELHAVFERPSGELAVVGQLYETGAADPFLAQLVPFLPDEPGEEVSAPVQLDLRDAFVNLDRYFTYDGSLTTPPCTEIVTWYVLRTPAQMSDAQFTAFNGIMGNNFRPLQPLNGRVVTQTPD